MYPITVTKRGAGEVGSLLLTSDVVGINTNLGVITKVTAAGFQTADGTRYQFRRNPVVTAKYGEAKKFGFQTQAVAASVDAAPALA